MADRTVAVRLTANVAQYQQQMTRAARSTGALNKQARAAGGGVGNLTGDLRSMAGGLLGVAGLKKGLDATIGAAIQWESAFAGVRKTVNGTEAELQGISRGLRQMSLAIPTGAEDLAAIAESAGQLGIETPNVLGFTKVIADLGETTNLAGQEGATQLARFANITQMSQDDFDRLGSTIVALGNNFATTEAEIVAMGLRLAGSGKQVGMTEPQILSLAAALSSVGVEAEAGGSAFSRVMVEINKAVMSGSGELETFAQTAGMATGDFATAWRTDAAGALGEFIVGLGGVIDQGGNADAILEELGLDGLRVSDSLKRAAGAGDLFARTQETGNKAHRENIDLTKEAQQRYETTEAQLEMLGNLYSEAGRAIGEEYLPELAELLHNLRMLERIATRAGGGEEGALSKMMGEFDLTDIPTGINQIFRLKGMVESLGMRARGLIGNFIPGGREMLQGTTAWFADSSRDIDAISGKVLRAQADAYAAWQETRVAALGAADGVGTYAEVTLAAAEASEDFTDAQKDYLDAVEGFTDPIGIYMGLLEEKQEAEREAAEKAAEAAGLSASAWEQFAGKVDVSLDEYANALEEQITNSQAWQQNLSLVAARVGEDVAMHLAGMGEEGIDLVAAMATGTAEEVQRMADLLRIEMMMAGMAAGEGFVMGLDGWIDKAAAKAAELGRRASLATRTEIRVESPSKEFEEIGMYAGMGFEVGLDKSMTRAFQTFTPDIAPARATAIASAGGGASSTPVDITLMMDSQRLWHSRGFIDGRNRWIAENARLTGRI